MSSRSLLPRLPARGALLLAALSGCSGNGYTFSGEPVWELFPFDGQRTWDYISTDTEIPHKLIVASMNEPEVIAQKNVYTLDYYKECVASDPDCVDGAMLRQIRWSSDIEDGVFIHGYSIDGGALVDLSPPIQVAHDVQKRDEFIDTETGGATWTSTFVGNEPCPIRMNANWEECGTFEITTSAGDGYPIAGKWWATKGNGVAAMQIATETGQWQLSDLSCEGECDGRW